MGSSVSGRVLAQEPGSAPALTHLQFICHLVLLYCLEPPLCTPCTSLVPLAEYIYFIDTMSRQRCLFENHNIIQRSQLSRLERRYRACVVQNLQVRAPNYSLDFISTNNYVPLYVYAPLLQRSCVYYFCTGHWPMELNRKMFGERSFLSIIQFPKIQIIQYNFYIE